jgi:hypothetical protein
MDDKHSKNLPLGPSYDARLKPPALKLEVVEVPEGFLRWNRSSSKIFDVECESGGR